MKCFNHPERDAVASCQKCGKGLCRECAEKHTPCMCDACAARVQKDRLRQAQNRENQRKQKYKDALVDTRSEFITTAVIGIIVAILLAWWTADHNSRPVGFLESVGVFFCSFCIPFGWKFLTYLQSFLPITLFGTWWFWFIYLVVKVLASVFVGVPAFIYQLVKTIRAQRKIDKLK